jgi:hypothetical protein
MTLRPHYPRERIPVSIELEVWWAQKKSSFRDSNPGPSGPQQIHCTSYTVPAPQNNPYASAGTPAPALQSAAHSLYELHCSGSPEKSLCLCRYSNPCPSGPQHVRCTSYTPGSPEKSSRFCRYSNLCPPARSTFVVPATLSRLPINS